MKTRPILFSADMIRALLDGRKTQTRRIVKPELASNFDEPRGQADVDAGYPFVETDDGFISAKKLCPYGQPGNLLWVRETWGLVTMHCLTHRLPPHDQVTYKAGRRVMDSRNAPPDHDFEKWPVTISDDLKPTRWRPSIHMPRYASRLTLRVTDVRVERVQEMEGQHPGDSDAIAEGVYAIHHGDGDYYYSAFRNDPHPKNWLSPTDAFCELWDSINAARGYGWDANPWVWVIEFEVIHKNIDQVLQEKAA